MSKETGRTDYGMTEKGAVTLIAFVSYTDDGEPVEAFQVRHGVRTVGDYSTRRDAELVAGALVGVAPEPEPPAKEEKKVEAKAEPEEEKAPTRRRS